MAPPPLTPAPSRFLLSKRQGKQKDAVQRTPLASGTPKFALSTPRPAASSSSNQPAFVTPFHSTAKTRPSRTWLTSEDIDDASPESSLRRSQHLPAPSDRRDPIEIGSSFSQAYVSDEDGERSPKRRRVSISSDDPIEVDSQSQPQQQPADEVYEFSPESSRVLPSPVEFEDEYLPEEYDEALLHSENESLEDDATEPHSSIEEDISEPEMDKKDSEAQGEPVFHKPRRFKVSEQLYSDQHPKLPEAFSPRRRGVRYIPGGMAAELQGWLIQTKGDWQDGGSRAHVPHLVAKEVRPGAGMTLVRGDVAHDGRAEKGSAEVRVMLAGEGRQTGLSKIKISKGSIISIAQPTWEVDLDDGEGKWVVATNWEVKDKDS